MANKLGRNDACPCGSGKKFKKCHGDLLQMERIERAMASAPMMLARLEAKEHQRAVQQGLGRPIVALETNDGVRIVAVKDRLLHSKKWKTFHDFLSDYIKAALGPEWGNTELKKSLEERHPLLVWYHKVCDHQRQFVKEPGKISGGPATGAVQAYLQLAYDLYELDHNAELQTKLIERLRNKENFFGARYEVQVAATLVRAGFNIEFEDEDDRNSSHCEFTATNTKTGRQFSVEAKRAETGRVTRQIVRALKKSAKHTRIVFIDLNAPDNLPHETPPSFVQRAFDLLRRFETLDPMAQRLPSAYIILTNAPYEHHLDDTIWRSMALADGFHIADFKLDRPFPSLREAISAREIHSEMHELLRSMKTHSSIPSTFDGESPEFAFSASEPRLLIGNRYKVPDTDGTEVEGVLTSAAVMENEKMAMCGITMDDGRGLIVQIPMTEAELSAWRRHPETFFGEVSKNGKSESALDFYDFLMKSYSKTPKEKLLEFMAGAIDFDRLSALKQEELASVYCERMASSIAAQSGPHPQPLLQSRWRRTSKAGRPR